MIDKSGRSLAEAVAVIPSGATVLVGGFGDIGVPLELVAALAERDVRDLTIVSNNAGTGERGLALLFKHRRVSRVIASFPSQAGADHFFAAYEEGKLDVELVPQGTLAERLRAGGAGLAGFFTPTGYGTELTRGKETREIDGRGYVYEKALTADFALVKAAKADRFGNLRYRLASRNFNPLMAMAARHTIAQVGEIVPAGGIDPDDVHTPGVFVNQIVEVAQ
ncbi:MAG TPA: 3-oxoacid CoA-transferase subunit A [Ramlibacter sp.]|uniref:3-oxoacid CoA-transferase subunit A n=1 Tax=Ramlibacter sp. TaxID=1917967 RepID=UPI002CEB27A3|nr:3-oxoacid CoA-transferase subunit A [Ramlibacter sp.]HVZ45958.1 3-oxoacid CoA-transferase subunit A [Ramlibacter sp.]